MILRLPFPDSALFPNRKNGKHWGASHAAKVSARGNFARILAVFLVKGG